MLYIQNWWTIPLIILYVYSYNLAIVWKKFLFKHWIFLVIIRLTLNAIICKRVYRMVNSNFFLGPGLKICLLEVLLHQPRNLVWCPSRRAFKEYWGELLHLLTRYEIDRHSYLVPTHLVSTFCHSLTIYCKYERLLYILLSNITNISKMT